MLSSEYQNPSSFADAANSIVAFSKETQGFISTIRVPLPKSPRLRPHLKRSPIERSKPVHSRSSAELGKLKRRVRLVLGQLVICVWAVIGLSYVLVRMYEREEERNSPAEVAIEIGVCGLSLYQVLLVVLYWDWSSLHNKGIRKALGHTSNSTLRTSRLYQAMCLTECLYHMMLPYPGTFYCCTTWVIGQSTSFSVCDLLFILTSLRQYHLLRLMYWLSPLPSLRVRLYSDLWELHSVVFHCKYLLAQYHLKVIGYVSGLMITVSGFVMYGLEHGSYSTNLHSVWDNF